MSESEWIPWSGGKCPVEALKSVEARCRDGAKEIARAYRFDWRHDPDFPIPSDIIAYRIVDPAK